MKRFAYVCADAGIPVPGNKGASNHVLSVCRALVAAGLDGELHTARPTAESIVGLPVHRMELAPRVEAANDDERELRLALSGTGVDVPIRRDCDFIYERYSLWHLGGLRRARENGVPLVLEVNSPLPEEAARFRRLQHTELAHGIATTLMRCADGLVCVSEKVADWVRALRGRADGVWVVPNGVDTDLFHAGDRVRPGELPADVPLVAFVGTFRPWHDLNDLLIAMRILADRHDTPAHLVCVGDGPTRSAFLASAERQGLSDRVHCPGAMPQHDVPRWLRGADVAVAPYPALENFYFSPLKIFEFMALGLPVVAADVGQIPALVADGERGLLYPPGQPDELARALARLLDDREQARRMGRAGCAWVRANATWRDRVGSILDSIRRLQTPAKGIRA